MKKTLFFILLFSAAFSADGYDPSFSSVIEEVYAEHHAYPGDWCDELSNRIKEITEKKGSSATYLELKQEGIDEDYLDAMAIAYCKKHPDAYVAIIWPRMKYEHEALIFNILTKKCQVAYKKKFTLKNNGPAALMLEIPEKVPHVAKHFHQYFPRAMSEYPMICYVLRAPNHATTIKTKRNLRGIMDIKPYCIHINDTHKEGMDLAYLLLNNNSIHFLNHHKMQKEGQFEGLVKQYENLVKEKELREKDVCVSAEGVLTAYGVKKIPLDFISSTPCALKEEKNEEWSTLGLSIAETIYNPKNFFYFKNHKFAALPQVRSFKKLKKEKEDLTQIDSILDDTPSFHTRFVAFCRSFFQPKGG